MASHYSQARSRHQKYTTGAGPIEPFVYRFESFREVLSVVSQRIPSRPAEIRIAAPAGCGSTTLLHYISQFGGWDQLALTSSVPSQFVGRLLNSDRLMLHWIETNSQSQGGVWRDHRCSPNFGTTIRIVEEVSFDADARLGPLTREELPRFLKCHAIHHQTSTTGFDPAVIARIHHQTDGRIGPLMNWLGRGRARASAA